MKTMTFGQIVEGLSPEQHDEMAWHLAMFRARKTWEALRWKANVASFIAATTSVTAASQRPSKSSRTRKRTVINAPEKDKT